MSFKVELEFEQVERISRDYLIDLLEDCTSPKVIESLNCAISYMSVSGTWEDGKYDDYS